MRQKRGARSEEERSFSRDGDQLGSAGAPGTPAICATDRRRSEHSCAVPVSPTLCREPSTRSWSRCGVSGTASWITPPDAIHVAQKSGVLELEAAGRYSRALDQRDDPASIRGRRKELGARHRGL
jgi:hypothetical protein